MPSPKKIQWKIEADFLQACNCDYGCPCEFEAPPTRGDCQGLGAWQITRGQCGEIKLDGLGFAYAAHWPGPLHKGNGTGALFFDEKANPAQRKALERIATGAAGGMPFEVIAVTLSKLLKPQFLPFTFTIDGRNSRVRIGSVLEIALEPIKNPVTGSAESLRVEHETGFMFKRAEVVSAKTCQVGAGELSFSWPNKAGFFSEVTYSNY